MRKTVQARTPDDHHALKLRKPKTRQLEFRRTSSSLHGLSKMGVIKTVKHSRWSTKRRVLTAPDVRGLTPNIALCSNL